MKLKRLLVLPICFCCCLMFFGCNIGSNSDDKHTINNSKGKYFVGSEYIIAYAAQTSTLRDSNGNIIEYGIDIHHQEDIKLNYLSFKCDLYYKGKVVDTLEKEVSTASGFLGATGFIPMQTTHDYDRAKVTCTGYSDENPSNFVRLNAMSAVQMINCEHKNLMSAKIEDIKTNGRRDYMIIMYSTTTAYSNFRFCYDTYQEIETENARVCLDCGYYSLIY